MLEQVIKKISCFFFFLKIEFFPIDSPVYKVSSKRKQRFKRIKSHHVTNRRTYRQTDKLNGKIVELKLGPYLVRSTSK